MIVGIMQPYFFPYLGYWQLINAVDKYVVYDDVTFIKGGWISRNRVLLNGQPHMLTLPLDNPSSFRLINEISITSNIKVRQKLLKTIESAYRKAPYFHNVMSIIEDLLMSNDKIADLNYNTILSLKDYLDMDTEIILSSHFNKDCSLSGQDKVLDINKRLGADTYINSVGGKSLYSDKDFAAQGITLKFLEMNRVDYPQYDNEFVPDLSIIDVCMFNSPEKIKELLSEYTLTTKEEQ